MKNNKLIAEFMGVQVRTYVGGKISYNPNLDWALLMPVVQKILEINDSSGSYIEEVLTMKYWLSEANRQKTYNAVVAFIEYYNENK